MDRATADESRAVTKVACEVTGKQFEVSELETYLRQKLDAPAPRRFPQLTFQHLLAFWQHFALHKRSCEYSGRSIISVFDENCPYPVWDRSDWLEHADPPSAEVDFTRPFFEQLWTLFQLCPIPHNVGLGNENCEYTDDFWYSKNCYLCHSGITNEDCQYCYRIVNCKDCRFCVFTTSSELSTELINCTDCFSVVFALNCRNCTDSVFLLDCRNCDHCLFCWNLRHKRYCVENKQLSREEYEAIRESYDLRSRKVFRAAKSKFVALIKEKAFWKPFDVEKCESCMGSYLANNKNCENCYFLSESEDCVHTMRGVEMRDQLFCIGGGMSEFVYLSTMAVDNCYDIRYCFNVFRSKYLEYCAFCVNCESCFACCGLVGRKYSILNQQYSPAEYEVLVAKLREKLTQEGLEDEFFPAHFAANSYDESLAGFYFPLSLAEQQEQGFRVKDTAERRNKSYLSSGALPDSVVDTDESVCEKVFWDDTSNRPFRIAKNDIAFSQKNQTPLPDRYYLRNLKELYSWLFFNGQLRESRCAVSGRLIRTNLPKELDGRILGMEAYLDRIG